MRNHWKALALIGALFAYSAVAKCPVGPISASIKQANGLTITLVAINAYTDDGTLNPPYETAVSDFGTIRLGSGDTLLIAVGGSSCGVAGSLSRNGVAMVHSATLGNLFYMSRLYKCTLSGSYSGGCCDEGCTQVSFDIAPLSGATGSVSLALNVVLGGAQVSSNSSMMRNDLRSQGLLPLAEPYTNMGYSFVGGGGETISGTASSSLVDWLVLELRSASQPGIVVASKAVLLTWVGQVIDANTQQDPVVTIPPGYYYVALRHRNHLGVMTASPVLLNTNAAAFINFNDATLSTHGVEAMQTTGSVRSLWPGNSKWTTGTQQIKYVGGNNDRDVVLTRIGGTTPSATASGYFSEDINLDGLVKYTGTGNDRDIMLQTIGGSMPNATRTEQLP